MTVNKGVLLIDVDSTIPNLALMKISAYYKKKGEDVGFGIKNPKYVYASCVFKKNKHKLDGLQFFFPYATIDYGGSGYDLFKKLPDEIDRQTPDYDLYPGCDRYYGFTTRGCIRHCYFCIVPEKEGCFKRLYESPKDCLDNIIGLKNMNRFNKIEFMDNNILADKRWFMDLTDELINNYPDFSVDFNQGLDIRLMDNDIARQLKRLKPITCWKFAFDDIRYKDDVIKGIKILNDNGVNTRSKVMFYVYVHSDEQFYDALNRCNILKENKATPYIMLNQDVEHSKRMKDLKRWCRPWLFWATEFNEYKR